MLKKKCCDDQVVLKWVNHFKLLEKTKVPKKEAEHFVFFTVVLSLSTNLITTNTFHFVAYCSGNTHYPFKPWKTMIYWYFVTL